MDVTSSSSALDTLAGCRVRRRPIHGARDVRNLGRLFPADKMQRASGESLAELRKSARGGGYRIEPRQDGDRADLQNESVLHVRERHCVETVAKQALIDFRLLRQIGRIGQDEVATLGTAFGLRHAGQSNDCESDERCGERPFHLAASRSVDPWTYGEP